MVIDQGLKQRLNSVAGRVIQHVEIAVGELAHALNSVDDIVWEVPENMGKDLFKRCSKIAKQGGDWKGVVANALYNDEDTCHDLATDKLYEWVAKAVCEYDLSLMQGPTPPNECIKYVKDQMNSRFHIKMY